jgi:hypothetical protein
VREARWRPPAGFRDPGWAEFQFEPLGDAGARWLRLVLASEPGSDPLKISFFQYESVRRSLVQRAEKRWIDRAGIPVAQFLFDRTEPGTRDELADLRDRTANATDGRGA